MNKIEELKERLKVAVNAQAAEGLLFSGGLDSSILAALNPRLKAITVILQRAGEDMKYAQEIANFLNLNHMMVTIGIDEAIEAVPEVIGILKTFDPAIPNDLVVYFGLRKVREMGIKSVMTGDGADEFFAGYSFMEQIEDLGMYIKQISLAPVFSSNVLGNYFKQIIVQPFLEKEFVQFALEIPSEFKVREENSLRFGKWILRKAFEDLLMPFAWQSKRPLEYGSGMTFLRQIISSKISDQEFEEKKRFYPIRFMNKEHLYYYEIYKKQVGEIPKVEKNQKICPGCGTGLHQKAFHCRICGYVLNSVKLSGLWIEKESNIDKIQM